ncbi:hypothetical protein AB4379_12245 [Vibrio breoganii]
MYMNGKHDKTLTELTEFRWAFGGLLLLSAVLFAVIAYNSDLKWSFDYEGFNFFVKAFSVPIAVLTSIIPIVGFIALNHRSVQTKEQIELARTQNMFTNYYKHIEEFEKYLDRSKMTFNVNAVETHSNVFPLARQGKYGATQVSKLDQRIEKVASLFSKYLDQTGNREQFRIFGKGAISELSFLKITICSHMASKLTNVRTIGDTYYQQINEDDYSIILASLHDFNWHFRKYQYIVAFGDSSTHPLNGNTLDKFEMFLYWYKDYQREYNFCKEDDRELLRQRLIGLSDENVTVLKFQSRYYSH